MSLKLYTYPASKNAAKALIAAEYNGVKITQPPFEMGVTNKTAAFLKLNPLGKVPTLETPEGGIFESNAIARFVARQAPSGLLGATAVEAAQVDMWIDYASNEIDGPLSSWIYPMWGIWPFDKKKEDGAKESLKKTFAVLDKVLESRTFLVGNSVTLADVVLACTLWTGMKNLFDAGFRAPFPSLCRYYATIANQAPFVKVLGAFELFDKPLVYSAAAAGAPKKEEAPKKEKAEKAKPAPKKADEEEEDDSPDGYELEKPKKNPLDDLPKSKMVLDSWKRLYSNTPAAKFKEICCKGLWSGADIPNSPTGEHFEGFDAEGYSIWLIEHKYPEEQKVQFRALNAVSGFFQRCDYARKHAFGIVSILQDTAAGTFPIKGFWIFRGQEVNWQMVEECPDLEVYQLTKVDPADPAVRARVEAFLSEEEKIDGCTNMEAKVFK